MRKLTDVDLDRLDVFLLHQDDDDVMMLSELDGYLTGVLVCPEMILPSEWMPVIWGDVGPVYEDEDEARDILGLIMAFYNDIAGSLARSDGYGPLIDEDIDGTFLWEFWAEGFGKALALRPWAWETFADRPDEDRAAMAFSMLTALALIARETDHGAGPDEDLNETLMNEAPMMIATCVLDLHEDRIANHQPHPAAARVGRNDPCPCGSGKKYKKCCLQGENR